MPWRSLLHAATYILAFITVWLMWPRELDGSLGRLGEAIVPDYRMENSRYVSVKDGHRDTEMYGEKSNFDLIAHEMKSDIVTIFFYDAEGKKTVVNAKHGDFFMEEKRFHLIGDVRSETPDGFVMTGPEANYHLKDKRFEAPLPVQGVMKDGSMQIWGDRARGDLLQKKIWLYGNARANHLDKGKLTKIRGDRAELDRLLSEAQFFEHVRVDQDRTVSTSRFAKLYYSNEEKNLRYMSLHEDVKITEASGKYTRSQVAEFFNPTDTVVLTVFPAVYDGDDVVTGDKITMYRNTGVVEVISTNAASNQERLGKKGQSTLKHSEEDDELIP